MQYALTKETGRILTTTLIGMVWSSICRYLHQTRSGGTADDLRLCPRIDSHPRREWTGFKYPKEREKQSFSLGRAPNRPHVHLTAVRPERQSNPQGFDREAEFSVQQTEVKLSHVARITNRYSKNIESKMVERCATHDYYSTALQRFYLQSGGSVAKFLPTTSDGASARQHEYHSLWCGRILQQIPSD